MGESPPPPDHPITRTPARRHLGHGGADVGDAQVPDEALRAQGHQGFQRGVERYTRPPRTPVPTMAAVPANLHETYGIPEWYWDSPDRDEIADLVVRRAGALLM